MDPVAQLADARLDGSKPDVCSSETAVPHASLGYVTVGVNKVAVWTPIEAASQKPWGNVAPVAGENAVCLADEVAPHMSSANDTCLGDQPVISLRKEPLNARRYAPRRDSAADWKLHLVSTGFDEMSTRTQIYDAFDHECVSFLISLAASEIATLRPGVGSALAVHTHSWTCYVCARFRAPLSRRAVLDFVKRSLPISFVTLSLTFVRDWAGTIEKVSATDVDAVFKGIEETHLHWQIRLWVQIVHGGMRSFSPFDPRFRDMVAHHAGAKLTFEQLLLKHRKAQNMLNARRITYRDCIDPKTVDNGIMRDVEWAKHVVDWFAERLTPADLNSRSLYVWGGSGVGKSRFLERLFEAQECFRSECAGPFFLQGLSQDHQYVWLDDFLPNGLTRNKHYRRQFDQLAGREYLTVRHKRGNHYVVCADTIRTVVTSNEEPPDDELFKRQFFVVVATEAMYDAILTAQPRARKLLQQSNIISVEGVLALTQAGDSRGSKLAKCDTD